MEKRKRVYRLISFFIAMLIALTMLPTKFAYVAPSVQNMLKTNMQKGRILDTPYLYATYNYDYYKQLPDDKGPVYRNPANLSKPGEWIFDKVDDKTVVRPGNVENASMGFAIDLKELKLLGAALKGQLAAVNSIYYDNYKGDSEFGQPFIVFYNEKGQVISTKWGDAKDVSDWINNTMVEVVPKNTSYIIFGAYGERKGGVGNKALNLMLNSIDGIIYDFTAPWVVEVTNDYPNHLNENNEIIKQNTQAEEPNIYITMSEDCDFPNNMKVTLYDEDNKTTTVGLEQVKNFYTLKSNGDVTYKFRIKVEELYNNNIRKHFTRLQINDFTVSDTVGNENKVTGLTCKKRIDTKPPEIENDGYPNVFKIRDNFGLGKITTTMTSSSNISNTKSELEVEKRSTRVSAAEKIRRVTIQNTTNVTDVFKVTIEASDLVYDTSAKYKNSNTSTMQRELFLISEQQPLRFSLINSNNPLLNFAHEEVKESTKNVLTNMYLKTSIDPKYLLTDSNPNTRDPVIYYKWSSYYDENILTEDPIAKNWEAVKFKNNSMKQKQ
ncbi:MAG TPA: hypothetical protein GX396_08920 [Tissierellia bacterium]|nr:hypothetical protein [Tissierellia bacterium]